MLPLSHQGLDLFRSPFQLASELFCGWVSVPVPHQVTLCGVELLQAFNNMHWKPDCPALVGKCACNRLANPPCGVGAELEAPVRVVLLDCPHQSEIPFLHQVQQWQTTAQVPTRDAHYKPQVGIGQPLGSGLAPGCDFSPPLL